VYSTYPGAVCLVPTYTPSACAAFLTPQSPSWPATWCGTTTSWTPTVTGPSPAGSLPPQKLAPRSPEGPVPAAPCTPTATSSASSSSASGWCRSASSSPSPSTTWRSRGQVCGTKDPAPNRTPDIWNTGANPSYSTMRGGGRPGVPSHFDCVCNAGKSQGTTTPRTDTPAVSKAPQSCFAFSGSIDSASDDAAFGGLIQAVAHAPMPPCPHAPPLITYIPFTRHLIISSNGYSDHSVSTMFFACSRSLSEIVSLEGCQVSRSGTIPPAVSTSPKGALPPVGACVAPSGPRSPTSSPRGCRPSRARSSARTPTPSPSPIRPTNRCADPRPPNYFTVHLLYTSVLWCVFFGW